MSKELVIPEPTQSQMTVVSRQDVEALKKQRELLREFVASQLIEAKFGNGESGEGDYGIIPGTKKRCLLKPGAEKLQRLFQLGCKYTQVEKIIEREANFAMYTYKAEVYSLRNPSVIISECEASVNSQEVKYKERTVWREIKDAKGKGTGRKEQVKEETPIFDVINTIQKMAQKRAMIGATLLATGASEYFTQDMLEEDDFSSEPREAKKQDEAQPEDASTAKEQGDKPMCCGKPMMVSKYPDKVTGQIHWYCLKCKTSGEVVSS